MSNHGNIANLEIITMSKGMIDERSLIDIFDIDSDFSTNEDAFRPDTLKKGFKSESERVSKEIFVKCRKKNKDDEESLVNAMMEEVFKVENFIGNSSYYGSYRYAITETEFEYVISIAYVN